METKLYIIGDSADKDNILALCSELSAKGVQVDAIFPAEDRASSENACSVPVALLWISSKAGSQLFNIALERNKRNLTTLNLFAEPVTLYDSERSAVGRNQSVFTEVNPEGLVEDLIALIGKNKQSTSQRVPKNKIAQKTTLHASQINIPEKASVVKEQQSIPISKPKDESKEEKSHSVSDAEVESKEEQEDNQISDNKRALWMPWVWYVCSIIYYVLIAQGIIDMWTNQTMKWLLITSVFFILAYIIVRSTIRAIKTSKWCYVYIPFSLFMVFYDLFYGFRLLGGLFD